MALRGNGILIRRVIEDIKDIYYKYVNKKTGKTIGMLQVMPREIRTYEVAFPETEKENIQKDIMQVIAKHNVGQVGGVALHWGPFKKDKYNADGSEMI